MKIPHIVIIGGGFGGLYTAQHLKHVQAKITLIDRRNFHLFQPLLYQVATGALSPANIAAPLRAILKRHKNTEVLLAEVVDLEPHQNTLQLNNGKSLDYDHLIIATGASHNYFGNDHWKQFAPGLKSIEDATEIRRKILMAFEHAEQTEDLEERQAYLRFIVIGGGPTGVELAGALGEIAHQTLKHNFRQINPASAEIILVEASDRILQPYHPKLSEKARQALEDLGVQVLLNTRVTEISENNLKIQTPTGIQELQSHTILWGAGIQASPLGRILHEKTGVELDRSGRVCVAPDLSLPQAPNIYVIGDLAYCPDKNGHPLPGVAPVAMQQGKYLAKNLQARLKQTALKTPAFTYLDKGSMATIGRSKAIASVGALHFSGGIAWMMWLFIHVLFLVEFQNRLLVLLQWSWNYITRNRSARLITGSKEDTLPSK